MDENRVMEHLLAQYNYLLETKRYPEDNIVGIFLYGSQNYGLANDESDIDSIAIVIPSLKHLCFQQLWITHEFHYNNEHINVKDIRSYRELLEKQSINYLETLFTDYCYINPRYIDLFQYYFLDHKEEIARYNRASTLGVVMGTAQSAAHGLATQKKLCHIYRLYFFLQDFLSDKPYEECLKPSGDKHDFLWNLKYSKSPIYQNTEYLIQQAERVNKLINQLVSENRGIRSTNFKIAETTLHDGVYNIFDFYFKNRKEVVVDDEYTKVF